MHTEYVIYVFIELINDILNAIIHTEYIQSLFLLSLVCCEIVYANRNIHTMLSAER